jgi:calcium-dependent protein kinase
MDNFKISAEDLVAEHTGQLRDSYEVKELLGQGSFGSVRKVTHRLTGEDRAMKILSKKHISTPEDFQVIQNEVHILSQLDHPNILKVYETFQDKFSYCIITELCTGGELFDRISSSGSISEAVSASYARQILSCLVYLHDRHIVHRDLKPENFLLSDPSPGANLKLIDFGTAVVLEPSAFLSVQAGTSYYIAPEVMRGKYTEKCDVWSAGVIVFMMLSGTPPFDGNSDAEIMSNVSKGKYFFNGRTWDGISSDAKDFVRQLMTLDPSSRVSAKAALAHPWMFQARRHTLDSAQAGRILQNLRTFHWEKKLQKATMAFIVSQLTTKDEREEMLELFKSLDKDGNGTLSRQEILEGMNLFSRVTGIEEEVDRIMLQVDSDGSGEIDYTEFITATLNKSRLLSRERLEIAFKMYDIDGSGTISKDELKAIFGKQKEYGDEFWENMIREVDKNGDGVIDIHEFSDMMLSLSF